uniref:F-box domain-containing protein n=1 Tax=Anopheles triannulatus TaxID=58253 RepID=A0A2M4AWH1_9DIPT
MQLLDLDEDSLMEIFSYFNFEELLFLSTVCLSFLHLCQRQLRKIRFFALDYRKVLERPNRIEHVRNIFQALGPSLEGFRFSGGYIMDETLKHAIVDNLGRNCTALRHLTINYVKLNEQHLKLLAPLLSSLVTLNLGHCDLEDASLLEFLQSHRLQLQILSLPGNSNLSGTFFHDWTNCDTLEQLDVSYCFSLNIDRMEEFLFRAKRLTAINVTGSLWLQRNKQIFLIQGRTITMGTDIPEFQYSEGG